MATSRLSRLVSPPSLAALVFTLGGCGFPADKPNIVMITLDSFRLDRMEAYGGTGLTPTLDALAEQGTVFSHAVVSAGTTYPSHATMFTGLYPRRHAVRNNFSQLPEDIPTLAEKLTAAGYDAGAFVSFKGMLVNGNLGKGFNFVSDTQRSEEPFRDGVQTARLALNWLDSRRGDQKPVFLWYHNFDAHLPLRITDHAREKLDQMGYQGSWRDGASIDEVTPRQSEIRASEPLKEAIAALYDGEVINVDKAVNFLLSGLRERGILENSVVFLVADHGEALGEHGWFGHGATLVETVVRTPLVIVDFRNPEHRIVEETVGTLDLTPTILELTGAEQIPGQGRSLVPALKGEEIEPGEYYVEVKLNRADNRPHWYDVDRLAIYFEEFKLEYSFGKTALFDLSHDYYAVNPAPLTDVRHETINVYLKGLAESYLETKGTANAASLDAETIEQLKSLGYVQ